MKKKNQFVKIITIMVIIVMLIASFWTGFLVLLWPSWNIKTKDNKDDNTQKIYNDIVWDDNLKDWYTTWDIISTWSATTLWTVVSTGSK